ncbi:MAG: DUF3467 domain-containing protein [Candidatus Methanoperedenaceae archaeon HGW-Methanoperedenaceae-1]|jgi:hypothetical protein|nr:MAG: DUF3467 domain-containing protein [Candidatus Methanoperedenaceae archaeon HGW-Methanoperedenaceae-1]
MQDLHGAGDNMAGAINVEITKARDFRQVYAIGATGGHTPYDFRMSFYNDSPKSFGNGQELQKMERIIETEVILSPAAAKELANWLMSHVNDYEKMFGSITQTTQAEDPKKKKSGTNSPIQGYM